MQHIRKEVKLFMLVILICIEFYSLYIINCFEVSSIYDSPLFRTVEFLLGVLICSIREDFRRLFNNWCYFLISVISIWGICFIRTHKGRMEYFLYIPVCVLVYAVSRISLYGTMNQKSKVLTIGITIINYASSLCYAFYILQCILWAPFYAICNLSPVFGINRYRCMLAFSLLLGGTIIIHEIYEKPLKKLMNKGYSFLKKYQSHGG